MGVTPTDSHGDGYDAGGAHPTEAPTSLLSGAVGDRCANCGAALASDQRYCVQCGERRGQSRFSPATMTAPPVQTTTTVTRAPDPGPRRPSSGATVVAGIATLVLALGVGVEIGHIANHGDNSGGKAPAAQVITVNGGGGGGGSSAQTTTAGGGSTAAPKGRHHVAAPPPKTEAKKAALAAKAAKPTQQAVQKASHAAASVLGGNGGQSNNTVTSGQSCVAGSAGCQGGHFTGNFFGQ